MLKLVESKLVGCTWDAESRTQRIYFNDEMYEQQLDYDPALFKPGNISIGNRNNKSRVADSLFDEFLSSHTPPPKKKSPRGIKPSQQSLNPKVVSYGTLTHL